LFANALRPSPLELRSQTTDSAKNMGGNASAYLNQNIFLPPLTSFNEFFLQHDEWIPLKESGWYQLTVPLTGSFSRLGMHQVIENSCYSPQKAPFMALYMPRTQEIFEACMSEQPYYDLELLGKVIRSSEPHMGGSSMGNSVFSKLNKDQEKEAATIAATVPSMQVVFAVKSIEEFMFLVCEVRTQTWTLGYCSAAGVTILDQLVDSEIRANTFYNVLIQLRGPNLSVDINNTPVFTSLKCPPEMGGLGGYQGVLARKGTRFAVKGWKLRGVAGPELVVGRRGGGNVRETEHSQSEVEIPHHEQQYQEQVREEEALEYEDFDSDYYYASAGAGAGGGGDDLEESFVQEPVRDFTGGGASRGGSGNSSKGVVLMEDNNGEQYYAPPHRGGSGGGGLDEIAAASWGNADSVPSPVPVPASAPKGKAMSLADLMKAKKEQRGGVSPRTAGGDAAAGGACNGGTGTESGGGSGNNSISSSASSSNKNINNHWSAPAQPQNVTSTPTVVRYAVAASAFAAGNGNGNGNGNGGPPGASSAFQTPAVRRRASESITLRGDPATTSKTGGFMQQQAAARRHSTMAPGNNWSHAAAATPAAHINPYPATYTASNGASASAGAPSSVLGNDGGGAVFPNDETPYHPDALHSQHHHGSSNPRMAEATRDLMMRHEKSVVDTVMRDVVQHDLGVAFSDIAALGEAKRLLSEAVILPLAMPEFFTGIREPWKGVLLFGPPGTGKTLLAKAVCALNQSSFFSCPSSSLVSKFRGESEKIVRCLFEAARCMAPAVVFLDEVDALVGSRGESGEHEASRRLKTEIFSQMDGIASSNNSGSSSGTKEGEGGAPGAGRVMVLATTNCPWDLDEAIRRRLEKRIFIPLPDKAARVDLFSICLKGITLGNDVDVAHLASLGEGYSGADIHVVCRDAAMMPMRRMLEHVGDPTHVAAFVAAQTRDEDGRTQVEEVSMADFVAALKNTRPSVAAGASERYAKWEREYGSK
jgi:katanin p60 ATPase-containing subunit A1